MEILYIYTIKQTDMKITKEMIRLLEDLYCETAGSFNDHGLRPSDFEKSSVMEVKIFLASRGLIKITPKTIKSHLIEDFGSLKNAVLAINQNRLREILQKHDIIDQNWLMNRVHLLKGKSLFDIFGFMYGIKDEGSL